MSKPTNDEKMAVAIVQPLLAGDPATVLLGISEAGWEYAKDGLTHTVDLSKVGIPVQIIVFRGKDTADLADTVIKAAAAAGGDVDDYRGRPVADLPNLGIDKKRGH